MAAKRKSGRKARKPKFVEIEGHKLTEAMYVDYLRCVESRNETNRGADGGRIAELALGDFLSGYRPTRKIKEQLHDITLAGIDAAIAIGSMADYPWYSSRSDSIRGTGCNLIQRLALDLYNVSAKLTAIANSVQVEHRTKLQDWLAMDAEIAQIGEEMADA